MTKNTNIWHLCFNCIENEEFSLWIQNHGHKGKCDFNSSHGSSSEVVTLDEFSAHIDDWFRESYQWGGEYPVLSEDSDRICYEKYGCYYREILEEELQCDSNIIDAIVHNLYDSPEDDPFYDDWMRYESKEEAQIRENAEQKEYWFENRIYFQWEEFCESVKYKQRVMNIRELLDVLFGEAESYSEGERSPVYKIIAGTKIYRARKLVNGLTSDIMSKNPKKELGNPPFELTTPGRMNFQGIPVFYAAFSANLALIETQPYIGETIVVGEFTTTKDIKVFDFTIYNEIHDALYESNKDSSKFSDTRYQLISHLQEEISKPISPNNQPLDYLPTQVITEYIREHFKVDGIIYFSSLLLPNSNQERRNILLFIESHHEESIYKYLSLNEEKINYKRVNEIKYEISHDIDPDPF